MITNQSKIKKHGLRKNELEYWSKGEHTQNEE